MDKEPQVNKLKKVWFEYTGLISDFFVIQVVLNKNPWSLAVNSGTLFNSKANFSESPKLLSSPLLDDK